MIRLTEKIVEYSSVSIGRPETRYLTGVDIVCLFSRRFPTRSLTGGKQAK